MPACCGSATPDLVASECETALRRGYTAIKLHETTAPAVFAARRAIGDDIPLMVDMNCPMTAAEAIAFAHECKAAAPMFLEEPVWPPEDFAALAETRTKGGLDIAAGENACTVHQFRQMMEAGAVSYAQPSVTKVGGITEYLKVVDLADEMGVRLAPHSPYFGPGFLATLQLLSLRDDKTFVEFFYMNRAACLWRGAIDVGADGTVAVPEGPGLGYEPDREVMERLSRLAGASPGRTAPVVALHRGRWRCQERVEPLLNDGVAFARRLLQARSVKDLYDAAAIADEAGRLHRLCGKRYGFSISPKHLR